MDIKILQTLVHYSLHLIFPIVIARVFFKSDWKRAYLIMLGTMLVDLDHLFANPIFDPNRCSIGYHYLHTKYAIAGYVLMFFFKGNYRIVSVGLLFHMFTDWQDCLWRNLY